MSRARPSLCGAASPAGNRISCCEFDWSHWAEPNGWVLSGTSVLPPSVPCLPISFASKALPKPSHFPLSLMPPAKSPVPPASTRASCCNLPLTICLSQSVLLQAARGIFLKLQITSFHSPNLSVAQQPQNKNHIPPHNPKEAWPL